MQQTLFVVAGAFVLGALLLQEEVQWIWVVVAGVMLGLYFLWKKNYGNVEKKVEKKVEKEQTNKGLVKEEESGLPKLSIVYATVKGTALRFSKRLESQAEKNGFKAKLWNISEYDVDQLPSEGWIVFVVSTYTDGVPPDSARVFFDWLSDAVVDHRIPKNFFTDVKYAIFGCGNKLYGRNFNLVARTLDKHLRTKSGHRLIPLGLGDEDTGALDDQFDTWCSNLWRALKRDLSIKLKKAEAVKKESKRAFDAGEESYSEDDEKSNEMVDVEDMGNAVVSTEERNEEPDVETPKIPLDQMTNEMLNPVLRKELTKQGYKLIGSHSGVKLCRWTKNMLRGRGGCYKHTFYGISSYQCMEMTPSLACANKCVFCWRHHTNPVTKEWRWKADNPEFLISQAMENHRRLMNSMRGVPGVSPERLEESMTIKHCALSLVGEPIIYPYINEFVDLLHENNISSFLVTNAQFPEKLLEMKPVTQLYISIDAATEDTLKAIDRPLFSDFWQRHIQSVDALAKYPQRTVHRLTLVKEHNMEEVRDYAALVVRGIPDFVEVKGVTFCGKSDASNLTIKNTPFHEEVISFCKDLVDTINSTLPNHDKAEYGIACEHEHSLCVLIANKNKFLINGNWHTWIDYPKFHQLVKSGKNFSATDYMAETPQWALHGSTERGFDPEEERFKRAKPKPPTGGC
jgi:tRNA wybutosine-synthesizing protein 1